MHCTMKVTVLPVYIYLSVCLSVATFSATVQQENNIHNMKNCVQEMLCKRYKKKQKNPIALAYQSTIWLLVCCGGIRGYTGGRVTKRLRCSVQYYSNATYNANVFVTAFTSVCKCVCHVNLFVSAVNVFVTTCKLICLIV